MASTKKKRIQKGDIGYFKAEKKRKLITTLILFAVPLFIFFTSLIYFKTRMTIWTVVAVVGCIPACKFTVDLIMIWMRKPMDQELYDKISSRAEGLTMSYEMYMTFYEKSAYIDAFVICGNTVVGYSSDPKIDCKFMAEECQKLVRKNGYKVDVKITKELRTFLDRLDSIREKKDTLEEGLTFTPDERYPGFTRNDMIKHTILALCI